MISLTNKLFAIVTGWVISIWVARQLGPTNYGIFTLVLWLNNTLMWAFGMGFSQATTKFVAEYREQNDIASIAPIVSFICKVELGITLLGTLVLILLRTPIADFFFSPQQSFLFFIAFIGLTPGILTAILSSAIQGLQKFSFFLWANLCITPLSFIAKIVVLVMGKGAAGLLVVMLIFSFVNAVFYFIVLRRQGIRFFASGRPMGPALKKRVMKFNLGVFAILVCDKVVWDKSENFFLGRWCPAQQVAFYNLGFNVTQRIVSLLPMTFWQVLFPAMSGFFGTGHREKMKKVFFISTRYLAFFTFPLCIGGMVLAYHIIHYFYGHDYIGAHRVMQIILFSSLFSSLTPPGSAVLYAYEKHAFIYKFGAVLAVFNIVLDILLIKQYGAIGAAICYGITTILGAVIGLIYTCRTMHLSYPIKTLLKIGASAAVMAAVMEIILHFLPFIMGFILSFCAGCMVYGTCALYLGRFHEEDFQILFLVAGKLPVPLSTAATGAVSLLQRVKGRENRV
jgi:O-antigen/teichoic acid export membrane protein